MKLEIIEKQINQKVIEYINDTIDINNLVNFVNKFDPKYIYKYLENPKKINLGHVMDMIQEYDFYKKNSNEQIVIDEIIKYSKNI
jgi:hypothetical protein